MRVLYTPWTPAQIVAELVKIGCACNGDDPSPALSHSVTQVDDEPSSYRARHTCAYCGKVVHEVADPSFVMPADVDR